MTSEIAGAKTIFSDNFATDGPIDSTKWDYNHWSQNNNTSYYGNTNIRQSLPNASGGVMHLLFDTYNPLDSNHNTFLGSEAITKQTFDLSGGPIAFEAQVRYAQNQPGIIGGFFTLFRGSPQSHDEIDFEAMSNTFNAIQTNIYHNSPYGNGDPISTQFNPSSNLSDFHTYRIEWYPNMVRWLVDGVEVRKDTSDVPDHPMAMHFNEWSGFPGWPTSSQLTQPVSTGPGNTYTFDVKSVKVETLSPSLLGGTNNATIQGGSSNDYLVGDANNNTISGGGGDDIIDGAGGFNKALYSGAAANYKLSAEHGQKFLTVADKSGTDGTDTLLNVQSLQFADSTFDTSSILEAAGLHPSEFVPLVELYTAYLHRAPDATGLAYWAAKHAEGMSLRDIAETFYALSGQGISGSQGKSLSDIVSSAYVDLIGHSPDASGLNFWIGKLQSGQIKLADFALNFIQAAHATGGDQKILDEVSIGSYYAIDKGLTDISHAKSALSAADFNSAKSLIDGYASAALAGESELTVDLGLDSGSIVPVNTPFNYNLGINYETWGRKNTTADLDAISKQFSLIRTYHDTEMTDWSPGKPFYLDSTLPPVISYIASHPGLQIVLGTNNGALAVDNNWPQNTSWSPGYMTNSAYTDAWVKAIITAFGDSPIANPTNTQLPKNTLAHLPAILLGNEVDANGPNSTIDPSDFALYQGWIQSSFTNLQQSMAKYGLGSVPISTTIANYPTIASANPIASGTVDFIKTHWSSSWNNGTPFVMFNQYTQNDQSSTDFSYVTNYFNSLTKLGVEPFIGETGETSFVGSANGHTYTPDGQQVVYDAINKWLASQNNPSPGTANGKTVPIFLFQAFDTTNGDPAQAHDGIFIDSATGGPTTGSLKTGVSLPSWSNIPIGQDLPSSQYDYTKGILNAYQNTFNL